MSRKSNLKGFLFGLSFYLWIAISAMAWWFILGIASPRSDSGANLLYQSIRTGVVSVWGLVFLMLLALLAFTSGYICAKYSALDGKQKPLILGFLLIIPAIFLNAFYTGATKVYEVAIVAIVTIVALGKGFAKYKTD